MPFLTPTRSQSLLVAVICENGGDCLWRRRANPTYLVDRCECVMLRQGRTRRCVLSRRIGYLFLVLLTMWTMMTINIFVFMPYTTNLRQSHLLRREIIKLSEEYVQALAKENGDMIDGPYVGRYTGYDMKKTMAVLLDDMMIRLAHLEHSVGVNRTNISIARNNTEAKHGNAHYQPLYLTDILAGKTEVCTLTDADIEMYPNCQNKVAWMERMWKSHACYSTFGVDGTMCSFLMFLSEVESFCPQKSWRRRETTKSLSRYRNATVRTEIDGLLRLLVDPNDRHAYSFMRLRVTRMWGKWVVAITALVSKQNMSSRAHKRVLIHLGLLTKQIGWKFAENQFSGGPLGEIVQWTDLITVLYILGHDITITSEVEQVRHIDENDWNEWRTMGEVFTQRMLHQLPSANSPCQNINSLPMDLLYTDIGGLRHIKKYLSVGYEKFKCLLRIVDSFGTQPAFNHHMYSKKHKMHTPWGGHALNPRQFFTMFPHTPDNSFMGFVIDYNPQTQSSQPRMNQALVYGKRGVFWQDRHKYIKLIHATFDVHATVSLNETDVRFVPPYVTNHGILASQKLHELLRQTKVFIGLGFPYEGPAPLEAIANGAVFLNPKFNVPHHRGNVKFLKGKPTSRKITSQHPYAESFIGEPHVYTIDIENHELVHNTLLRILNTSHFEPFLPFEFTEEGMLQRMSAYIQHQNFCPLRHADLSPRWPPPSSVHTLLAPLDTDCTDFCLSQGLICEPTYFPDMNTVAAFLKVNIKCKLKKSLSDIFVPGINVSVPVCLFQAEVLLFSCAGQSPTTQRLCPCRTYMKQQTALCQGCVR